MAVPELQMLCVNHGPAVLAFELENRAYFAESISDRGDAFYDTLAERLGSMLAEQATGASAFYVYTDEAGAILGRFNLYGIKDGIATLGYRVAQHAAGHGVATAAALTLCGLAATQYGLRALMAATSHDNVASQRVLLKIGFVPIGPADPADIGGKQGTLYRRALTAGGVALRHVHGQQTRVNCR